ncbi:hypothetical protein NDI39_30690 [Microcoleus sp. ZQ-A2]|nr:hypothetical protein [Microcoleus sp. FACHB-1]
MRSTRTVCIAQHRIPEPKAQMRCYQYPHHSFCHFRKPTTLAKIKTQEYALAVLAVWAKACSAYQPKAV